MAGSDGIGVGWDGDGWRYGSSSGKLSDMA